MLCLTNASLILRVGMLLGCGDTDVKSIAGLCSVRLLAASLGISTGLGRVLGSLVKQNDHNIASKTLPTTRAERVTASEYCSL